MGNHTPGPWIFGEAGSRRIKANGPYCDGVAQLQDLPIGAKENEMIRANGFLIAAAPEMYEALKDLFKMMDEEILVRNTSGDINSDWAFRTIGVVTRLKTAYSAIEKAEGKV